MANGIIEKVTPIVISFTGTTTETGALALPTPVKFGTLVDVYGSLTPYLIFRRDFNYLMLKDPSSLQPISSTEVTIYIAYVP